MLQPRESSRKGGLVTEAGKQCDLAERSPVFHKKAFRALNPELNEPLMDRGAEAYTKASHEMTLRKGAGASQFPNGNTSFEVRPQHLLCAELFAKAPGRT